MPCLFCGREAGWPPGSPAASCWLPCRNLPACLRGRPSPPAAAEGAVSRTDVRLEASDLRLTLSPDVLELGSRLAASALEPLMQVGREWREDVLAPLSACSCSSLCTTLAGCLLHCRQHLAAPLLLPTLRAHSILYPQPAHPPHTPICFPSRLQPQPNQPLASCSQFERVWSFDPADLLAAQQGPAGQLAVSLSVTGAEGGVTVWRAKAPTGYAVAGDIVTPGSSQVR